MEIQATPEDDVLILALRGDFDTTEVDYFNAEIQTAIDAGHFRVILDLTGLTFINSTALGSLIRAQKLCAQYGGSLCCFGAQPMVKRTMELLELDRRIPIHEDLAAAREWTASQNPEGVSGGGEEVTFLVLGAEEAFGTRPRKGRVEEIVEDGMAITFENLEGLDIARALPAGALVELKFRIPLYHPTHVFDVKGTVTGHEFLGPETVLFRVELTEIEEAEREAIRQYVKDLRFLSD